jgi:hypothetical protein
MPEVQLPPDEVAAALGLSRRRPAKKRRTQKTCEDCFFHRKMLCALDLDEPCSTFREDRAGGLVPPRQPLLLPRQEEPVAEAA